MKHISGVDIRQVYIDAAIQFSTLRGIQADFEIGFGESLPFGDDTFDAILSFDVFEHVQNVEKTLHECYRVLKKDGRLFVVFPGYFQPNGHHLSHVTSLPCIHYFFSSQALIRAYYEILEERGDDAYWYKRSSPNLEYWEKGNTINGTTILKFKRLIKDGDWRVVRHIKKPVGSVGESPPCLNEVGQI